MLDLFTCNYPEYLYHATYKENLPSIKIHGLGNCKSKEVYAWGNDYKSTDHVFLHEDIDSAVAYAESSDYVPEGWLDEIVVIAVKTKTLDVNNLKADPNLSEPDGSVLYWGKIPFKKLELIEIDNDLTTMRLK